MSESARPPTSSTAAMTTPTRRRRRCITSNLYAFRAEPALHLGLDPVELVLCARFEAHHYHRLGVGGANEPPAITKEHANSIDGYDLVLCAEVLLRLLDDSELLVIRTINSYLGR